MAPERLGFPDSENVDGESPPYRCEISGDEIKALIPVEDAQRLIEEWETFYQKEIDRFVGMEGGQEKVLLCERLKEWRMNAKRSFEYLGVEIPGMGILSLGSYSCLVEGGYSTVSLKDCNKLKLRGLLERSREYTKFLYNGDPLERFKGKKTPKKCTVTGNCILSIAENMDEALALLREIERSLKRCEIEMMVNRTTDQSQKNATIKELEIARLLMNMKLTGVNTNIGPVCLEGLGFYMENLAEARKQDCPSRLQKGVFYKCKPITNHFR